MNELAIIENGVLTDINKALKKITKHHKKVSSITTPKAFIKQKMGMDYVEYSVMRDIADKEYPGWSWTVIKTEFAGTEAYVVHGRLKWFDNGVWREGDATAAHRVQKERGSNDYVDLGNALNISGDFTIKVRVNITELNSSGPYTIFSKSDETHSLKSLSFRISISLSI